MDEQEALAVIGYIITRRIIHRRKNVCRRFWVHPIVSNRVLSGQFYRLHSELQEDPEKFFSYYHMSERSFNELLILIEDDITKKTTNMRLPIPPEERLSITLRFLASGCSYSDLHFSYRVGLATITKIIRQVCSAIWKQLVHKVMALPNAEEWMKISDDFFRRTNFPNCLGCIDGKHIRITNPAHGGSMFLNYKHFFSIVLMAVCDSNYNFLFIDVGSYGKCSDSAIFKNTTLYKKLSEGNLNIPGDKPLPNSTITLPHVFIGDEAFGLSKNLMRPYGGKTLPVHKRVFNYRTARCRHYIECSFGILSNKWRVLQRPLNVSVNLAEVIVKALCVLHNFVRNRDGYTFEDTLTVEGLIPLATGGTSVRVKKVTDIRDKFAEYFMSPEGELPWQYIRATQRVLGDTPQG